MCLISAVALAQGPSNEEAPPPEHYRPHVRGHDGEPGDELKPSPFFVTGIGVSVEAGGGFGGYLGGGANSASTMAGLWTVRVTVGTRRHLAYEGAYVGSASTVNAFGLEHDAKLVSHGLETAVRFNLLTGMWQPYATAGVGIMHYSYGGSQVSSAAVDTSGNVVELPLGVGFDGRWNGFIADARFALHPATGWNLTPGANMSTWDLSARLGIEF